MNTKEAYIIDAVRTPVGKYRGMLSSMRTDNLASYIIKSLIKRYQNDVDLSCIEEVVMGCVNQAGEDNRNVARMALLLAGLPPSIPGYTINRLCASGMTAISTLFHSIKANEGDLFIAGGVENMTRAPFVMNKSERPYGSNVEIYDTSLGWRFINPIMEKMYGTESMVKTAENIASMMKISREDQDMFACQSHKKASNATQNKRLSKEIIPIEICIPKQNPYVFDKDETIRDNCSVETLKTLKPILKLDGKETITAGNASSLNDGAAAILIASSKGVKTHQLKPKARIVASASVGIEPRIMGLGPIEAIKKVLKRAQLTLDDMDVIEINEAFAAQILGVTRSLHLADNDERINPNGGAIAIGHPLGMSGARLVTTAMYELNIKKLRYALCTLCVGVGQGEAIIIENVNY